jgi:hypothetical protein
MRLQIQWRTTTSYMRDIFDTHYVPCTPKVEQRIVLLCSGLEQALTPWVTTNWLCRVGLHKWREHWFREEGYIGNMCRRCGARPNRKAR